MTAKYPEILPGEVHERIRTGKEIEILDVREHDEWESGHIPGAKHIPLGELPERLKELRPEKETIVVCRSGNRSGKACDYLSSLGHNVVNMTGGMKNWIGEVSAGK